MRTIWAGVLGLGLLAAGACDKGAPTCKDAVDRAVKNGAKSSDSEQALVIKTCEDKQWSAEIRGCLAKAASKHDARECLKPVIDDLGDLKGSIRDRIEAAAGEAKDVAGRAEAAADQAEAAAKAAVDRAQTAVDQAQAAIVQAKAAVDEIEKQASANAAEVDAAVTAVVEAKTDEARTKAQAALDALRAKKLEIETKIALARAAATAAARAQGLTYDP